MSKSKENSLPPVFKFSNLCNILQFYGRLHEWEWLLKSLSSKTSIIWCEHKRMFITWGQNNRTSKTINNNNLILRFMKDKYKLYSSFQIEFLEFYRLSPDLILSIGKDFSIVIDRSSYTGSFTRIRLINKRDLRYMN